jgi:hypothetical protein
LSLSVPAFGVVLALCFPIAQLLNIALKNAVNCTTNVNHVQNPNFTTICIALCVIFAKCYGQFHVLQHKFNADHF